MARLIFRNDDISPNTNLEDLKEIYSYLLRTFEINDIEIYSCVNIFSEKNSVGSVYKDVPFKDKGDVFLYNKTDSLLDLNILPYLRRVSTIVSHGLYHVDHSAIGYDAQVMSIVGSCRILGTSIFAPPFNRFNEDTEHVCEKNKIKLIKSNNWKSLEFNKFNIEHNLWYFHSWRYDLRKFKDAIDSRNRENVGQLSRLAR